MSKARAAKRRGDANRDSTSGVSRPFYLLKLLVGRFLDDTGAAEGSGIRRALVRSLVVVIPTYVLAAVGVKYAAEPMFGSDTPSLPMILLIPVVLLFTFSHAVIPVFFYYIFTFALESARTQNYNGASFWVAWGFVHLHMGIWYGAPMIGLAAMTGWITLVWAIGHMLFAGRGHRRWVFLEYGSTSLALLLFLVLFSGVSLFPVGLIVVVLQSLLLTLVDWKGYALWNKEPAAT